MKNKGFTLVELLVVMSVFLFVIGGAVMIFVSITQHQKKSLADQELLNQISYVEEYMSKALRMAKTAVDEEDINCMGADFAGYIYLLTRPETACEGIDQNCQFYKGIKFINQSDDNACQEFFLERLDPNDDTSPFVLQEIKDGGPAVPLTSGNLQIDYIRFGINGTDGSVANSPNPSGDESGRSAGAVQEDDEQPRVTILLGVKTRGDDESPSRIIQTTVSQRNLNAK